MKKTTDPKKNDTFDLRNMNLFETIQAVAAISGANIFQTNPKILKIKTNIPNLEKLTETMHLTKNIEYVQG